jgi:hypothetical protein
MKPLAVRRGGRRHGNLASAIAVAAAGHWPLVDRGLHVGHFRHEKKGSSSDTWPHGKNEGRGENAVRVAAVSRQPSRCSPLPTGGWTPATARDSAGMHARKRRRFPARFFHHGNESGEGVSGGPQRIELALRSEAELHHPRLRWRPRTASTHAGVPHGTLRSLASSP